MRKMGLDFGDRTIGIAVSDELGWTAQAKGVIRRTDLKKDLKILLDYIDKYQINEIVVGLPLNMDGSSGKRVEKTEAFVNFLKNNLEIPVVCWDERLTTIQAERILLEADMSRMKRKKVIDQLAASFILQSYLEAMNNNRRELDE